MVITHNMMAMNAQRQFGINNKNKAKSTEKLSSGYKINRAGDNAAGLSISEKMRGQIRGLSQASSNMEDAVSLVQTADGAMQEISKILQRERELCVQAANDTNTTEDREDIQMEIDSLSQDITRISENTEFNTRKILKGKKEKTVIVKTPIPLNDLEAKESYKSASMPGWVLGTDKNYPETETTQTGYLTEEFYSSTVVYRTAEVYDSKTNTWKAIVDDGKLARNIDTEEEKSWLKTGARSYELLANGKAKIIYPDKSESIKNLSSVATSIRSYLKNVGDKVEFYTEEGGTRAGAYVDFSNLNKKNVFDLINKKHPQAFNSTCCTCNNHYNVTFVDGGGNRAEEIGPHKIYYVDISETLNKARAGQNVTGEEVVDQILLALTENGSVWNEKGEVRPYDTMAGQKEHFSVYGKRDDNKNILVIYDYRKGQEAGGDYGKFDWGIYTEEGYTNSIQVSEKKLTIEQADWIRIQTGANAGQELAMVLPEISLEELGISELNVTKHEDAAFCLDRLDIAINYLNGERARIGAYQNRLEYSISRVDTAAENLTASESRIRDADMAEEMTDYSKENILAQAGSSVLASANQSADSVMMLLQ